MLREPRKKQRADALKTKDCRKRRRDKEAAMKVQLVDCKRLGLSHCWEKAHIFVTAMRPSGHLYICVFLYVNGLDS